MSSTDDMLERYRRDRDEEAFARIMERCRPAVTAVCRRYLIAPDDLEDAVQETFVKLARCAGSVRGNLTAWLSSAARTTAIDFTRQGLRRREHLQRLIRERLLERGEGMSWEAVQHRLEEGLAELDPESRSLIVARYFDGLSVRGIAKERKVSPPTVSRQVASATEKLCRALQGMGFRTLEDAAVAAGLVEPRPGQDVRTPYTVRPLSEGMLWEQEQVRGRTGRKQPTAGRGRGDWRRVIRIGVLVSELSTLTPSYEGVFRPVEHQLWATPWMRHSDFRLLSIVEPGTHELASIERGARGFGLTAGMIDAADPMALRLLDVIYLGQSYALPNRVLDAVAEAVSSGVGLYSEGQIASAVPGINHPKVRRLYLADQVGKYHTPGGHGRPMTATVLKAHPILKGLRPGDRLEVPGCGPVFTPRPREGTVLMQKDEPVVPLSPTDPPMPPTRMPAIAVGQLGRGRVVIAAFGPSRFVSHPALQLGFVDDAIEWLAEPSLKARQRRWSNGRPSGDGL